MTREEATERLKTDIYKYADFTENPNEDEFWMAFDMAIKALEQEPCDEYGNYRYPSDIELTEPNTATSMPCGDAISRQAVLDGIDTYIYKAQSTGTQDDFYSFAELVVKTLPSVTPQEPKTDTWSIKDVADTFKKHGLIREQEPIIDKIRAEIIEDIEKYNDIYDDTCHGLRMALDVIDKYTKGET